MEEIIVLKILRGKECPDSGEVNYIERQKAVLLGDITSIEDASDLELSEQPVCLVTLVEEQVLAVVSFATLQSFWQQWRKQALNIKQLFGNVG